MMLRSSLLYPILIGCAACAGCLGLEIFTASEYRTLPPQTDDGPAPTGYTARSQTDDALGDDRLEDKLAPPFDPQRVDRRPYGRWQINQSAAVLRLHVAPNDPRDEADLLRLYPSYAAAIAATRGHHAEDIVPSVNLIEFELSRMRVLSREELRAICDREKTKDAILKALQK